MSTWSHISEVGECADILAAFFDDDGMLQDVSMMTLVTTERGKFWVYIEAFDDREDGNLWPFDPWQAPQPEYFIPAPKFPDAIFQRMEKVN